MVRCPRVLLLLVVAAGQASCCCPAHPPSAPPLGTPPAQAPVAPRRPEAGKPLPIAGVGYEGAIFALGWAPSDEEVRRLEAGLPDARRASLPAAARPLADYFRQYGGGLDADGRRRIHVHGIHRDFLRETAIDPRTDVRLVADGGDSFFEAVYDPESGHFDSIEFHGNA